MRAVFKLIRENPVISVILLIALGLRLYGIYPGYPDIHPDESSSYATAVHLLYNFLKPDRFDYPAGVPLINALAYLVFFVPLSLIKVLFLDFKIDTVIQFVFSPHNFFLENKEAIFGNRDFYAMYFTRIVTAVFGTASVFLLYLVGKKLFTKEVGLFAAFFLAVNYLHVVRSHFGLPDVYNGFFALLSLYASILILEKNTVKRYLFAGFVSGIAFAIKYQVFSLIPFVTVHLVLTFRKRNIWYFFNKNIFLAAFVFVATFLIINPYYLLNIDEVMRMNRLDVLRYRMGILEFQPYPYFYLFNWGIDKLPSIMILFGIIAMLFRSTFRFFLVFPFVFVFMFFMTYYSQGGIFTRNFATVMPYLMLFAGYGIFVLWKLLKQLTPSTGKIIIIVLVILINLSPIKNSLILGMSYSKPWNETELSIWLRDKLPKNSVVRNYQLFLHNIGIQTIVDKNIELRDWDYSKGPNSLAEFQEEGTEFAILNTNSLQSITYWWRGYPQLYLGKDEVPFDYIENGFYGLTIRELLNYTVFESHKPWQAHYNDNYLVFKIPQKAKEKGKKIASFSFGKKEDMWELRGDFGFESMKVKWIGDSLIATSSGTTSRLSSPVISVREGLFYTVKARIKTNAQIDGERDGFLRIDLYEDDKKETLEEIGTSVAVSARALANDEWSEKEVSTIVPKGAKFMTVSFQFKNAYFTSIIDNVEIFESVDSPAERFNDVPYIKQTIPLESLYYNTFI